MSAGFQHLTAAVVLAFPGLCLHPDPFETHPVSWRELGRAGCDLM